MLLWSLLDLRIIDSIVASEQSSKVRICVQQALTPGERTHCCSPLLQVQNGGKVALHGMSRADPCLPYSLHVLGMPSPTLDCHA